MRKAVAWIALMMWPLSGLASDAAGAAMLYAKGKVTVNGNLVNDSTAIFSGSVIETSSDSVANVTVSGSTVLLQPTSLVRFDNNELYLDHGGVTVGSSTSMRVHVKCIIATPASNSWTQFDVIDVSGTVQVVDRKNAVNISTGPSYDLLKPASASVGGQQSKPRPGLTEGQQYNGYEREGCPNAEKKGAPPAAVSSILNSAYAPYIGAGVIAGVTIWVLIPVSTDGP